MNPYDESPNQMLSVAWGLENYFEIKMGLVWKDFSDGTTVHGLRFVNSDYSLQRRIFWAVLVVTGAVFFCTQFEKTVAGFFEYKVNTVVRISNDGLTKFPAITICNSNVLRKSQLQLNKNNKKLQRLLQLSKKFLFPGQVNATQDDSDARISGEDMRAFYKAYGHTMEPLAKGGMLQFCRAPNYASCNSSDFKRTLTYSGLCYTLNYAEEKNDREISARASGRFSAVRLGLSVQVQSG